MLIYRLLISSFSILLVIVAIGGLVLGAISPTARTQFTDRLAASLPGGTGQEVIGAVTSRLAQSAGILLVVSVALAAYTGSQLFLALERCFDIIFRVTGRRGFRRHLMAIGMLLLYAVLVPLVLMASIVPSAVLALLRSTHIALLANPLTVFLLQAAGILIAGLAAMVLFGAIYAVVPNRPLRPKEVWKGTLAASLLLLVANAIFPIYISVILKPQNRGSIAGLLVVILVYYFFQAYILLLGAEINAWHYGFEKPVGSLDAVMEQAQSLSDAGKWPVPERARRLVIGDESLPLDDNVVSV
jgi:membrane protein